MEVWRSLGNQNVPWDFAREFYLQTFHAPYPLFVQKQMLMGFLIDKLDGVSPVDNIPSTDKLHHFVPPPPKKKYMWHMTPDTWHVVGGEHFLKISAL